MLMQYAVRAEMLRRDRAGRTARRRSVGSRATVAAPHAEARHEGDTKAMRVLVVDDEPDIRTILRTALEAQGCAVAEAASGQRIVAHAKKHQPDIILLDIMMPGVDGYAALAALQRGKRTRDIPIAMLTALSDMSAIERAIDAGATGYLTKPFSIDLLYPQMEAIVDKAKDDSGHKLVDYSFSV